MAQVNDNIGITSQEIARVEHIQFFRLMLLVLNIKSSLLESEVYLGNCVYFIICIVLVLLLFAIKTYTFIRLL